MVPVARTALPCSVQRVKPAVWQVVSVPVAVVAAPRSIAHHARDVCDKFGFFVKENGQAHGAKGGVGCVQVVVPELVAGIVAVGGQVQHEGTLLTEALVGALNKVKRRFHRVTGEASHEEKTVLGPCERFHGFARQWPIVVGSPVVAADGAVVGASEQGQFLVKARLVVSTRDAQWNPLCGHEVVEAVH